MSEFVHTPLDTGRVEVLRCPLAHLLPLYIIFLSEVVGIQLQ